MDEAEEILRPYYGDIVAVIRCGWRAWKQEPPEKSARKSRRTRATWVHDEMTEEARRRFDDCSGVHVAEVHGFITLTFDNRLILRFKKFQGRRLLTSGVRTWQRNRFQYQQLTVEGIRITTVVAGYLLDDVEQELEKIAIVCPNGRTNEWVITLDEPADAAGNVTALTTQTGSFVTVAVRSAMVTDEEQKETS
jgi:hypothetical protein